MTHARHFTRSKALPRFSFLQDRRSSEEQEESEYKPNSFLWQRLMRMYCSVAQAETLRKTSSPGQTSLCLHSPPWKVQFLDGLSRPLAATISQPILGQDRRQDDESLVLALMKFTKTGIYQKLQSTTCENHKVPLSGRQSDSASPCATKIYDSSLLMHAVLPPRATKSPK